MKFKFLLLILSVFFICCNEKNKKIDEPDETSIYPVEIEFTYYDLYYCFDCAWTNIIQDCTVIVNSDEELKKYLTCTTEDWSEINYPEIDFSKNSLIIVNNYTPKVLEYFFANRILQISENIYELDLVARLYEYNYDIVNRFMIGFVTRKISEEAKVEVTLTCWEDNEELRDCAEDLYFYHGSNQQKNFLKNMSDKLAICFNLDVKEDELIDFVNSTDLFRWVYFYENSENLGYPENLGYLIAITKEQKTCSELNEIINILENSIYIEFVNLVFTRDNDYRFRFFLDEFKVIVYDLNDLSDLYAVAQETKTKIISQSYYSTTFTLRVDKNSAGNAMQMGNYFHETGKFRHAWAVFYPRYIF